MFGRGEGVVVVVAALVGAGVEVRVANTGRSRREGPLERAKYSFWGVLLKVNRSCGLWMGS